MSIVFLQACALHWGVQQRIYAVSNSAPHFISSQTSSDSTPEYSLNVNRQTSRRLASQKALVTANSAARERTVFTNVDLISGAAYGGAVYFGLGSRNSPLLLPLGKVLYGENATWVSDRRDGMYSSPPALFLGAYVGLCLVWGLGLDRAVLRLVVDGDEALTLQLGVLSFLSAGFLELSRIDSGEKNVSREESEREGVWFQEFEVSVCVSPSKQLTKLVLFKSPWPTPKSLRTPTNNT